MEPKISEDSTIESPVKSGEIPLIKRIWSVLGDIKFAHTLFALPFALLSAHLAFLETGGYRLNALVAILVCMVTARTSAMSFNRYSDRDLDAINPRTKGRSIPSGRARPVDALAVVIACCVIFIAACWYLGPLPLALSVPTIAFILSYSYAKRFTWMTHIWLGSALAIAPTGAWIAVTGEWSWFPVILSIAVVFWVAGFDIIYALQDIEFDRERKVFSIPARAGSGKALWIARAMHAVGFLALIIFGFQAQLAWPYWTALILTGILLIVEHSLVKPDDYSRVGIAFFTMNGVISVILYISVLFSTESGGL